MSFLEDRWIRTEPDPAGGKPKKTRLRRNGTGRRWRVRYTDPSGAEKSKSFVYQADAIRFRSSIDADLLRGTYIDPDAGRVTLRRYALETWLPAQGGEATTRERVRFRLDKHILPGLGGKTLAQLAQSPSLIRAWVHGLALSPATARSTLAQLHSVMASALDDGLIIRNPCTVRSVRAPAAPRRKVIPWTQEQARAVRAALPERYRVLSDLGEGLGLRQGEAFGLAVEDLNWPRADMAHITRQVRRVKGKLCFAPPKRGKERDVPVAESVKLRIAAHLAAFPAVTVTLPWKEPGGPPHTARLIVTTTQRGAAGASHFNHYVWKKALTAAGMPATRENGFHALRHYFASKLLASREVDIKTLASYLGHEDSAFTLRVYVHLLPGHESRMRSVIDETLAQPPEGPQTAPAKNGNEVCR